MKDISCVVQRRVVANAVMNCLHDSSVMKVFLLYEDSLMPVEIGALPVISLESSSVSTGLHDTIFQKTAILIFASVRTWESYKAQIDNIHTKNIWGVFCVIKCDEDKHLRNKKANRNWIKMLPKRTGYNA